MAPETRQPKGPESHFLTSSCVSRQLSAMAAFQEHEVTRSESSAGDASLAPQSFAIYTDFYYQFSQIPTFSVTDVKTICLLCLKRHKYWELRV